MFPGLTNLKTNTSPQANSTGLGKDNSMNNGIATQNLGGNSLTQTMRSIQNWLATQGAGTYQQGKDTTNTGIQGFGTAADTTGTALDTSKAALDTLSPAESYWSKLLSGDQKTMNEAIAPTALQAGNNYANAASNVAMNQPKGGYAGVLSAGLPQAQAREVNSMLYSLQPTAATNLNNIAQTKNAVAGTQGNIAGVQGQLANWLASLGIDISKLGLSGVTAADTSIMGGRSQDVAEHGQAMQMATALAGDVLNPAGQAFVKSVSPGKTPLPSDIRVKRNIEPLAAGLETVLKINPIEYDYNGKGGTVDGKHYVSVAAQELAEVLPESVSESEQPLEGFYSDRALQVDPVPVIWALVNAVKTLHARVEALEGR